MENVTDVDNTVSNAAPSVEGIDQDTLNEILAEAADEDDDGDDDVLGDAPGGDL